MMQKTRRAVDIDSIASNTKAIRSRLKNHRLYESIRTIHDVRKFMEYHVFLVWDFMSLLKSLQGTLTSVETPWVPKPNPFLTRLVNQIVLDEESDLDSDKQPASHYEIYLSSMEQLGADTKPVRKFVTAISEGQNHDEAIRKSELVPELAACLKFSLDQANSGAAHEVSAAFAFGRESIIPEIFEEILKPLRLDGRGDKFVYYLKRHIELDGGEHKDLAVQMVAHLCGDDQTRWLSAGDSAKKALELRLGVWDRIAFEIKAE